MNLRPRVSHLVVIAVVAFALALGGGVGAVAGAKWINGKTIKPNSIPANRIQKATISNKQLKKGAVTRKQLAQKSVTSQALSDEAVEELAPTVEYVDNTYQVAAGETRLQAVTCPAGTQVVGGYLKPGQTAAAGFLNSYIDPAQNAFMVEIGSFPNQPGQVTIQTICLR